MTSFSMCMLYPCTNLAAFLLVVLQVDTEHDTSFILHSERGKKLDTITMNIVHLLSSLHEHTHRKLHTFTIVQMYHQT